LFLNRNRLISTQELVNTIRQIQELSNQPIDTQVLDIIYQFDHNKDGFIDADEISKVKINIIFN
jgi:Ca2+-binding EF-hand superfamily protein